MEHATGEMARRIREFNWAATSIGPREGWPVTWRTVVDLILVSSYPAAVGLGPDQIYVYNDAFIPIGGPARHPSICGAQSRRLEEWTAAERSIFPILA